MGKRDDNEGKKRKHKHHDKEKKKHKKEKKHHRYDKRSRKDSDDDRAPVADYKVSMPTLLWTKALVCVQELLVEFPEIAKDLIGLLQLLDDGEVAVINGIENKRIRQQLETLFPLLGLSKLAEPKRAFAKRGRAQKDVSLLEVFQRMLSDTDGGGGDSGNEIEGKQSTRSKVNERAVDKSNEEKTERDSPTPPPQGVKRILPIGPAMPPSGYSASGNADEDDDDDDVIGPALPGMKGFRPADERVEAEMARRAEELRKEEWNKARGIASDETKATSASLARQEWMTMMPDNSFLKDSLGPVNRPQPGKPAAFRSKEPAAVDQSWFDAPEERDRAKRAKLDMELLGYVREENAPSASSESSSNRQTVAKSQPTVNESILPGANPEADEEIRKQMELLRQQRGPSLLEQHQQKIAKKARTKGVDASKPVWDRDRDLTIRKGMSREDADRIINDSKQINSKFTAPTISRQFL